MCPSLMYPSVSSAVRPFMAFFPCMMSISSPADGACYEKCIELRDHAGVAKVASAGPSASQTLISQPLPVYLRASVLW